MSGQRVRDLLALEPAPSICVCGDPIADHQRPDRTGARLCPADGCMCLRPDAEGPGGAAAAILLRHMQGHGTPELAARAGADLLREANRWQDAWASVKVQMDRAVRAASARALDCTDHGRLIAELERQAYHHSEAYRQSNQARVALVRGHFDLHEALTGLRKRIADGEQVTTTTDELADIVLRYLDRELLGHEAAYKTTAKKPAKAEQDALPLPDGAGQ